MANHQFLLPDDLGWECNDEISRAIDAWRNNFVKHMKAAGQDESGNWPMALWTVSKAELMDEIYAIIKKYQTKLMVDRFLGWKLPEDFSPDAGISFKPNFNEHTAHPDRHRPVGTNLFTATQATEMVKYMLEGPEAS